MRPGETSKTLREWMEPLLPDETQAIKEFYYTNDLEDEFTADDVLEAIVHWNGGIATAYHIKRIIGRVYGVEL